MPRLVPIVSALCLTLFLAGCETAEERAEGHYQSGLALLAEGDVERALVEFRNVFQLNGQHREARTTYARTVREQGKLSEAFGQYKRLVEQYPDDIDGRRALGEMAVAARNWEEAERHVEAGIRLAPQDPMLKALKATLDYRQAVMDEDRDARAEALARSTALLAADESNQFARAIVIDGQLIDRDYGLALEELNRGLELDPERMDFHDLKLRTLAQLERTDEVGVHLRSMIAQFPENQRIRGALINWYLRQGQLDEAEDFLRELAEAAPEEAKDGAKTTVVQFLQRTKGAEAAKAEVERLIAEGSNPPLFRSMRAAMMFDEGLRDGAIVELQDVLEGAPDNEQIRGIKIALARMLQVTGDAVGARALVEEVLVSDEANVAALKMKATWLIEEDKAGEAITILRSALDQNPRDAETLTIMARAHLRDGSRQLAGERLALAVEVSEKGAEESLRYAQFLVEDERLPVAESVLIDALKLAPENLDLLNALGQIYLRQGDWPRTEGIVTRLQELGRVPEGGTAAPETRRAEALGRGLRATLLLRQEKTNESIEYLQGIIKQGDGSISAIAGVLSTYLSKGQTDEARAFLDEELAKDTESLPLRFMDAQLDAASDKVEQAETKLLQLMEDSPESPAVVQALFTLYFRIGRIDEADKVLEQGLANTNRVPALLFLKANRLERTGDIEGTIALYEELYAGDTNNVVLANNLASMLVTHRNDQASLDRAYAVARRLRGATVPPLQDTYGWIEYRRGNYEVALEYLKPAAAGLPKDPLVQYHLGMTYLKLGQIETGRAQLLHALKIAGRSELPQFDDARRTLEALPEPEPETEAGTEGEESTGSD